MSGLGEAASPDVPAAGAEVTIAARFQGPPGCANGGYASGLLAARMAPGPLRVTLRRPVPLEAPLRISPRAENGGLELVDGAGEVLVEAVPAESPEVGTLPAIDVAAARAASPDPDWLGAHPFPSCFGCGPDRDPADAVALQAGRVSDDVWATAWVPGPGFEHDHSGALAPPIVWTALDCPSSFAAVPAGSPPHVLGRIEGDVRAPVHVGEEVVVAAWPLGHEGRKRWGASAILGPGGELRAVASATWIALA